jgi:AcrR family transcriptional regulator
MAKRTKQQAVQRRAYHHGDLRSAMITAAGKMLERDGPEAISFRAIARVVGVSQTAPYNHFRSKEHLLAVIAAVGFRELEASQRKAAPSASTDEERITALGRDYVRFARARPQRYRLMFGVGVVDWRAYPELAQAMEPSYRPIQEALAARLGSVRSGSPEAVAIAAVAAWALVHGLSMLLIDRAIDPASKLGHDGETLVAAVTAWFAAGLEAGATALSHTTAARAEPYQSRRRGVRRQLA